MTSPATATTIKERLEGVRGRIAAAAVKADRKPSDVVLMGATKAVPPEAIVEACKLGLCEIGENWVQEAEPKVAAVRKALAGTGHRISWHMIGHLQRNKAKDALAVFDAIDTLDNLRLAQELSKRASAAGRDVPIFLEVDYTDEAERTGFRLGKEPDGALLDNFLRDVDGIVSLPHLILEGLMTVPAPTEDPEGARPAFPRLRELRDLLNRRFPQAPCRHLSMGMTHDYIVAIQEGATIVRLGTAIFGPRPPGRTY